MNDFVAFTTYQDALYVLDVCGSLYRLDFSIDSECAYATKIEVRYEP